MPFELGLAVALGFLRSHRWVVVEARRYRLTASLSDLNGWDPFIHEGTPQGMLRALMHAFRRRGRGLPYEHLVSLLAFLEQVADERTRDYGTDDVFNRSVFDDLVYAGQDKAREMEQRLAVPHGSSS